MRILIPTMLLTLAACQPAAPDPRGVDHDETLLTVTATGRADATPDEARIQLGVQSLAGSAQEASTGQPRQDAEGDGHAGRASASSRSTSRPAT